MTTLTFWGNLNSKDTFIDLFSETLGSLILSKKIDGDNIYYTFKDDTNKSTGKGSTTLTLGTPESANTYDKFQTQLSTLTNLIQNIDTDKPKVKSYIVNQLSSYNSLIGIAFVDNDNKALLNFIWETIFLTVSQLNGVVLLSNRDLFDGQGNLLFSHDGKSDFTENDAFRFSKSIQILEEKSIKFTNANSFNLKENDCKLRSIDDICKRILALFEVAVYSQCILDNDLGQVVALQKLGDLNDKYNSFRYVTKQELEFLNATDLDSDTLGQFFLRFDSLATLLWCIGLIDDLGDPYQVCDFIKLSDFIYNFESIEKIIIRSNIRDIDQLLQLQDLNMRYFNTRSYDDNSPLNANVVRERLIALNWVLTTKFGDDWDDVVDNTI